MPSNDYNYSQFSYGTITKYLGKKPFIKLIVWVLLTVHHSNIHGYDHSETSNSREIIRIDIIRKSLSVLQH